MKQDTWNARKGREAANKDMGGTKPGGKPEIRAPLLKKDQTVRLADGGSPKGKSHGKSPRSKFARPAPPPIDPGAPPAGIGAGPPPMMPPAGMPPPGMNTGGRVVRDGKTNRFKRGGAAHEMNESKAERDYENSHGVKEPPKGMFPIKRAAGGAAKMRRDVASASGKPVSGVGRQVVNAGKPARGPKLYDTI